MPTTHLVRLHKRGNSRRDYFYAAINQKEFQECLVDTGSEFIAAPHALLDELQLASAAWIGPTMVQGVTGARMLGHIYEVELAIPARPGPLIWRAQVTFTDVATVIFGHRDGFEKWRSYAVDNASRQLTAVVE